MSNKEFHKKIWYMLTNTHMHDENELKEYNGTLYHYTTAEGLIGILQSNKIWATSAMFMNDINEINYGTKLVKNMLYELKNTTSSSTQEYLISHLYEKYDPEQIVEKNLDTYVACFSEKKDKLSQWKGFSNQGVGYAIGFDPKQLLFQNRPFPYVFISIKKVIYAEAQQQQIIKTEIKKYLNESISAGIDILRDKDSLNEIINVLNASIYYYSRSFKHKAFSEEHEWRALTIDLHELGGSREKDIPETKYRGNMNVIPYVELDLSPKCAKEKSEKLPISEIIVGPCIDFEINKYSINKLLKSKGWKNIPVNKSSMNMRL